MNVEAIALVYAMKLEREICDLRAEIHRLNSIKDGNEGSREFMAGRIQSLGNRVAKEARMLGYVVGKTPPIDKSKDPTP